MDNSKWCFQPLFIFMAERELENLLDKFKKALPSSVEYENLKIQLKPMIRKSKNLILIQTFKEILQANSQLFSSAQKLLSKDELTAQINKELEINVKQLDVEIEKSRLNNEELYKSGQDLDRSTTILKGALGALEHGNQIIKDLGFKDKKDRMILLASVLMFLISCLYVFVKRI